MIRFHDFWVLLESRESSDSLGSLYRSSMPADSRSQTDLYNSLRAEIIPPLHRARHEEADEAFQYVMAKFFAGDFKADPVQNLAGLVRNRVQLRMLQLKRDKKKREKRVYSGPPARSVDSPTDLASRGESMERLKAEIEDMINPAPRSADPAYPKNMTNTMGAVFCAAMGMKCRIDGKHGMRVELPADMAWGQVYRAMKDGFSHKIDMDTLLQKLRDDYGISLTKGSLSWYIWKFRRELADRLGITADSGYEDKSGKKRLGRLSSGEFTLSTKA